MWYSDVLRVRHYDPVSKVSKMTDNMYVRWHILFVTCRRDLSQTLWLLNHSLLVAHRIPTHFSSSYIRKAGYPKIIYFESISLDIPSVSHNVFIAISRRYGVYQGTLQLIMSLWYNVITDSIWSWGHFTSASANHVSIWTHKVSLATQRRYHFCLHAPGWGRYSNLRPRMHGRRAEMAWA